MEKAFRCPVAEGICRIVDTMKAYERTVAERGNTRMTMARAKSTVSAIDKSIQASLRIGDTSQKKWFKILLPQNATREIKYTFAMEMLKPLTQELMVS